MAVGIIPAFEKKCKHQKYRCKSALGSQLNARLFSLFPATPAMPESPVEKTNGPTRALIETVARVLAPLVRLLIAKGIPYQMASEILKRSYVDAARKHFPATEGETATRLSLLTGLNRKEIRRLTTELAEMKKPEDMTSYAAAVYAVWSRVRRWRDRDGKSKPLPRRAMGREASFDDLVRSVTLDHRPSAVLEELVRLHYAHEDATGTVHMNARAFLPQQIFEDKLTALGENLEDHTAAAVQNVLLEKPVHLERSVFSDELSTVSVERLRALVNSHWQQLHDASIESAVTAEEEDIEKQRPRNQRIRLGMYFYSEKKDDL